MKLEVIAANIDDIIEINKSNADRIEFCKDLKVGGLTPAFEDIKKAGEISKLPVNVMVRITDRDFYYTEEEFNSMLEDIKKINDTKISGIVIGIINKDGTVNVERMKKIMQTTNKKVTFHKAFDELKDYKKGVEVLSELGIDTILTAGGKDINENLSKLDEITKMNKVKILAGGGVGFNNFDKVKKVAHEIHVGTAVRKNKSWDFPVDIELINKAALEIK